MRSYTPAETEFLTGIPTDKFRDWRRRGLLEGFGVYSLGPMSWTRNPNHPGLPQNKRWVYLIGDVLCFAIVTELIKLGIELKLAFGIAEHAVPHVHAWALPGDDPSGFRSTRFMGAYPAGSGADVTPGKDAQAVRLDDLNRLSEYAGAAAIVLDFQRLAAALPQRVRAEIQGAR